MSLGVFGLFIGIPIGAAMAIAGWFSDKKEHIKHEKRLMIEAWQNGYMECIREYETEISHIEGRIDRVQATAENWMGYDRLPLIATFEPFEGDCGEIQI